MARTGRKIMFLNTTDPNEIDEITKFLKKKNKGLRYSVNFSHRSGLEITFFGPDDKIKLLEFELLQHLNIQDEDEY